MKRRVFIHRSAAAGALMATGSSHEVFSADHSSKGSTLQSLKPLVAISGSNEPELSCPAPLDEPLSWERVREVVRLALDRDDSPHSLVNLIRRESRVVVKPNIVTSPSVTEEFYAEGYPHWGLVTDLRVVKALIEYIIERTAPRRITIAEGPIWYTANGKLKPGRFEDGWHCVCEGFGGLSYAGIAEELSRNSHGTVVDIVDLNEDDAVYVRDFDPHGAGIGALQWVKPGDPDGTSSTDWTKRRGMFLPKTILDADVLITVPVMKTHSSAGVTLCLKNLVGCLHSQSYGDGNGKVKIHQGSQFGLIRGIADLACAIRPDYAVVEGFWAAVQQHLGQNGVNVNHNVVVAGGDVVAVEAVAMQVMGFNPLDSDLLRLVNRKKLGEWHPARIVVTGPPLNRLRLNFIRAANTYSARGVRKWLMKGPLKSTFSGLSELNIFPCERASGEGWSLLDGDSILDETVNVMEPYYRLQECLMYPLPGSWNAGKGSYYYLVLGISTERKDLCGQLLIGLKGGDVKVFLNGHEILYPREPFSYDPTPTAFLKFREGDNILILEIKKTRGRKEDVRLAANICDLDGDRLADVIFEPYGE